MDERQGSPSDAGLLELVHLAEQRDGVDRGIERLSAQLAVGSRHVEHEPRGLGPAGIGTEVDSLRCFERGKALLEEAARFRADVLEIGLHLLRPFDPAQWPVSRYDHARLERHDAVECGDPVGVRPFPADRRATPEQYVSGEYDPLPRQMYDDVPRGMGRADVEK